VFLNLDAVLCVVQTSINAPSATAATGCGREWGVVGFVKPPPVVPQPPPDQRLAGAVVRMVQDR
jgi:hypothetical protein